MKVKFLICAVFMSLKCWSQTPDKPDVMSDAYWALWNEDVQRKIDADIERNRKADATISVPGAASGAEINVEQMTHEFVFGANIFNFNQLGTSERNRRYKELFGNLFNSATIALYWKPFEMQPDRPRFKEEYWDTEAFWNTVDNPKSQPHWRRPAPDPVVTFAEGKGIRLHGHTMIWGSRRWQHPEWIVDFAPDNERKIIQSWGGGVKTPDGLGTSANKMTKAYEELTAGEIHAQIPEFSKEMKRLFEKRIRELSAYYGARMDSWDIVNESATDFSLGRMVPGDAICKSHYGLMPGDYTYESFRLAQTLLPNSALLNINDYKNDQSYVDQVKDLLKRGCNIDVLGSQMHLFNPQQCLDIAAGKPIEAPEKVWEKMATLSQAGLPIHLSEITITAPGDDERGRQIQAVVARNLYRLWFSIEKMMGITWWNIVDDCGAPGEPTTSGLFTRNMEPKPSYFALDQLINHEWKTNLQVQADGNSQIRFRGFKGKYRITWKDTDGEYREKIVDLTQDGTY